MERKYQCLQALPHAATPLEHQQQYSIRMHRTQRNSLKNSNIFLNFQASATTSPDKNYVEDKSNMFLSIDKKLSQCVQKKLNMKKSKSKMSILSMQKTKFVVSRKSTRIRSFKNSNASLMSGNLNSSMIDYKNLIKHKDEIENFKSYLKVIALNHPKKSKSRKCELLTTALIAYFIEAQEKDLKRDLFQLKEIGVSLLQSLTQQNYKMNLSILKKIERDVSKLVFNICYEIYRKKQKGVSSSELVKINKEIEYTARRLNFHDLALRTCFDLGEIFCNQMEYDRAFQEYTNAVKLAIFLKNRNLEESAIDKLGLCKYYLGDSVSALYFHNNASHLSQYDHARIKEQYSNETEIKRLLLEKKCKKVQRRQSSKYRALLGKENVERRADLENFENNFQPSEKYEPFEAQNIDIGEFTFEKQSRRQLYPLNNNVEFRQNLKKVIKVPQLRGKIHVLKNSLEKTNRIGQRKFTGEKKSLLPQASKCQKKESDVQLNEVCLSHRSYNRNNVEIETFKIQRDSKILILMLNYFLNDSYVTHNECDLIEETTNEEIQ